MSEPPSDPDAILAQFQDVFADLFGGASPRADAPLHADVRRTVVIALEEASDGCERELEVTRIWACEGCDGQGAEPGATWTPCRACEGAGGQSTQRGLFALKQTCEACRGAGGAWDRACRDCEGTRGQARAESVALEVPPGLPEAATLRIPGKGNVLGERTGDLLVQVTVQPDPRFRRDGADLHTRLAIGPELARDGGMATVPLLRGVRDVAVPRGARSGDTVPLRGCGMVRPGAPVVPLPSGDDRPYRSVDPGEHRGRLIVTLVVDGDPLPDAHLEPDEILAREEQREDVRSDARFRWSALAVGLVLIATWMFVAFSR